MLNPSDFNHPTAMFNPNRPIMHESERVPPTCGQIKDKAEKTNVFSAGWKFPDTGAIFYGFQTEKELIMSSFF